MACQDEVLEPCAKKARFTPTLNVGWFRNDLRLRDNPMLADLQTLAEQNGAPAQLVYIFDPRFYDRSEYGRVTDPGLEKSIDSRQPINFGSRKCNGRRARFYLNVLRDLQRGLEELGTSLKVFYGKAEDVFTRLSEQYGALQVVCLREPVSPEWTDVEDFVEAAVAAKGGILSRPWGAMSLYHEEDLPFHPRDAPGSYSGLAYALGWEDVWTCNGRTEAPTPIRRPLPAPSGPWRPRSPEPPAEAWAQATLDSDREVLTRLGYTPSEVEAALRAAHGGSRKGKGGETAAWARLTAWMEKVPEQGQAEFADWDLPTSGTQNADDSIDAFQWKNLSRPHGWMQLSKYLACGCISPREIFHTLSDANHWALPGVVHRLLWREWHRLNAIKYHRKLFWLQGPGRQNNVWKASPEIAERWKAGSTGIPYVDACIRELNETGWLGYKGRKTVAAVLALDLWIDWRVGAFHFEEMLLDYDAAMNYGNWVTCVRVDKNYRGESWRSPAHDDLRLKIAAEARNDPAGEYVKRWVPELKAVPAKYIQVPWMMPAEEMSAAGLTLGKDYPHPAIPAQKLQFLPEDIEAPERLTDESWAAQGAETAQGTSPGAEPEKGPAPGAEPAKDPSSSALPEPSGSPAAA